jgi:hypothetical protein
MALGAPVSVFPGDTLGAGLGEDEQAIDWLEGRGRRARGR